MISATRIKQESAHKCSLATYNAFLSKIPELCMVLTLILSIECGLLQYTARSPWSPEPIAWVLEDYMRSRQCNNSLDKLLLFTKSTLRGLSGVAILRQFDKRCPREAHVSKPQLGDEPSYLSHDTNPTQSPKQ